HGEGRDRERDPRDGVADERQRRRRQRRHQQDGQIVGTVRGDGLGCATRGGGSILFDQALLQRLDAHTVLHPRPTGVASRRAGEDTYPCASNDRPSRRVWVAVSAANSAMVSRCTMRPSSITTAWSPSASANRKFCSTSRIVVAPRLSSSKALIMLSMMAGAMPLVGSSRRISGRGSMTARAIDNICF